MTVFMCLLGLPMITRVCCWYSTWFVMIIVTRVVSMYSSWWISTLPVVCLCCGVSSSRPSLSAGCSVLKNSTTASRRWLATRWTGTGTSAGSSCPQHSWWWVQSWYLLYVVISVFQFVFGFYFIKYTPIKYGNDYEYPAWGEALGFLISLSSMIWVPGKCVA